MSITGPHIKIKNRENSHRYDDNKFVDCAIASNAHYLATNDKHFNILKGIEFPKVQVINVNEFSQILEVT